MTRGFTLLEVLLSLALFSIIALATVRQITLIRNTKQAAMEDIDLYSASRAALSMMRNDLSQAFHVLYEDLGEETRALVLQNRPAPHTLFDGRKDQIIFTSLSHRLYYQNRKECEQTEISYFLHRKDKAKTFSLMKRESAFIDSDLYQGGSIFTILDDVTSLQFQYWDAKNQKWVDEWNSDQGQFRDKFPNAVKIKITVLGEKEKKLEIDTEFKVTFPNNEAVVAQF